jgi:hypothetical protein
MPFASNSDIQTWFGDDKITVSDALSFKAKIEADRLIRGQLAGVFTALTISSWTSPGNTPELIRSIAGRLAAAYIYEAIYSEEQTALPEYAQKLYNDAIQMLQDIKTGNLIVVGADNNPIEESAGGFLSFWPDDTTSPKFTMDMEFS